MKHASLLIALCLVAATLCSQTASQKGDMQFEMRDMNLAISSYEAALKTDPENQDLIAKVAEAYVAKQDYLSASQWYEKIVDREDIKPVYLLEYAHVLKSLRLFAKARFYYQKYGQYDPEVAYQFIESSDMAKIEMAAAPYYKLTSLALNSRSSDFAPVIRDGNITYTSFRTDIEAPETRRTKKGVAVSSGSTVFQANKMGDGPVSSVANPMSSDAVVSHVRYSEDGKWVAFHKSDMKEGLRLFDSRPGKISLYVGQVESNGEWTNVKPFTFNSNDFSTGYPAFSPDGSVMYFSSNKPNGEGGWDIYMSVRGIDGWTTPRNVGDVVNTPGNEIAPFYADHKLYFSSDWHNGLGGFDIFKATSNEGQWVNVRAMGYPVNSSKDDFDFVWNPKDNVGYFSSNRVGTLGGYDIFMATPLYEEVEMIVMDQEGEVVISDAKISFIDRDGSPLRTDINGKAVIHQRFEEQSRIVIQHPGYKDLEMTIAAPGQGPARYEVYVDQSLAEEKTITNAGNEAISASEKKGSGQEPNQTQYEEKVEVVTQVKTITVGEPHAASETNSTSERGETETVGGVSTESITQSEPDRGMDTNAAAADRTKSQEEEAASVGMYAVQIAAARSQFKNLSDYNNLSTIGKVMQYPENGMYKIRVGYYKTPEQAKNALESIKRSGYNDAFVVAASPVESQPVSVDEGKYFVRLGTYSKPEYFQEDKVTHLGDVERRKRGDFTIMLLGSYGSLNDAEKALSGALKAGFKDAFVVDDDLKKINL